MLIKIGDSKKQRVSLELGASACAVRVLFDGDVVQGLTGFYVELTPEKQRLRCTALHVPGVVEPNADFVSYLRRHGWNVEVQRHTPTPYVSPKITSCSITHVDNGAAAIIEAINKASGDSGKETPPSAPAIPPVARIERQVPDSPGLWFLEREGTSMEIEDRWLTIVENLQMRLYPDGTSFQRSKSTPNGWFVDNTVEATDFQK